MSNYKYLFYDNIVRGSGLGHWLATYGAGYNLAKKENLQYMPAIAKVGHMDTGSPARHPGRIEEFFGLKNYREVREELYKSNPDAIKHIPYTIDNPTVNFFSKESRSLRKYLKSKYYNKPYNENSD